MKERIIETFNQLADVYEHTVDTTSLYNSEYERPSMLEQMPKELNNLHVLDAGCAAGWYTLQMLNQGANVVATDISEEMVSATRRRVGDKAKVLCLDLGEELPFEDNSFDMIMSSLTLHYIEDWGETFSEFKRILKPKGVLLFSIHHPLTDLQLLQDANYFSTELILDVWNKEGRKYKVPFYRRPLSSVLNETLKYFSMEKVIEPLPTIKFKTLAPEKYQKLMKSPQFLIIKALK